MKDRNRKGKFRRIESVTYKMAKHTGFDAVSWMAFQEAALEKYASEEEEKSSSRVVALMVSALKVPRRRREVAAHQTAKYA